MKKVILGSAMVLAMAAGVFATGSEPAATGKKAGAACCTMDDCCTAGAETSEGCCIEGCCG